MKNERKLKKTRRYGNMENPNIIEIMKRKIKEKMKNMKDAEILDVGGIFKLQKSKTLLSLSM